MIWNNDTSDYTVLCKNLGYQFKNKKLLVQALTRTSAVIEGKQSMAIGDFQRLEFIGDKILNLVIGNLLFETHSDWSPANLTIATSQYVNNKGPLAKVALSIGLDKYLIMNIAEDSHNHARENIKVLSDAMEALLGAVFVDCKKNYQVIEQLIEKHWLPLGLLSSDDLILLEKKQDQIECWPQDNLDEKLPVYIRENDSGKVGEVLKQGANPNLVIKIDEGGLFDPITRSVLQYAATLKTKESFAIIRSLLEYKADPNWQGGTLTIDEKPLAFSRMISLEDYVDHKRGRYKKSVADKKTALHYLADNSCLKKNASESAEERIEDELSDFAVSMQLFARLSSETSSADELRVTMKLVVDIAQLLVDSKADVTLRDYHGDTALSTAKRQSSPNLALIGLFRKISPDPELEMCKTLSRKFFVNAMHETLSAALPEWDDDHLFGEITTPLVRSFFGGGDS